jgi:hypothetical protein
MDSGLAPIGAPRSDSGCAAVFGKDHAQTSMIPKSVQRFSEKIMLKQA